MNYTEAQKKVIATRDRNLLVIAIAGCGKSECVAMRIVRLISEGVQPRNIVAFTFTEKAAAELKSRIRQRITEHIGECIGLPDMFIGTIHGFCLRLLQEHVPRYLKYTILSGVQVNLFVDKHYQEIGIEELEMERYKQTDSFVETMSILRENVIAIEKMPRKYQQAIKRYEKVMDEYSHFDFTAIMSKALWQIEHNETLRNKLRETIRYLTVDEYQDVNPIQEQIIRCLHELGANICAVGDDDQTIYQWRGSDISNILTFDKRYKAETVFLTDNFRSTEGVIRLADGIIRGNVHRKHKEMKANGEAYEEGDIVYHESKDDWNEAYFIVSHIKRLQAAGIPYSEMAILLRINRIGGSIIEMMNIHGIPIDVAGTKALFNTAEGWAMKRIFQYLNGEVEYKTVRESWERIDNVRQNHLEKALRGLQRWKPERHTSYKAYSFQTAFYAFLDAVDLKEAEGASDPKMERALYTLGALSGVINDFETVHFKTPPKRKLDEFCRFLRTMAWDYSEAESRQALIDIDAVRIMTIHQAKGLEFKAVFIPGLSRNIFPIKKFSGESVWSHMPEDIVPNKERYLSGDIEDERRLFYVALTRSKKYLILSRAPYNRNLNKVQSSFLIEAKRSPFIFEYNKNIEQKVYKQEVAASKKPIELAVNFSMLEGYYKCPYRFKMGALYGFHQPLAAEIGYGKALHNLVQDIHKRAVDRHPISLKVIQQLVDEHLHLPYADKSMIQAMRKKALSDAERYYELNREDFENIEYSEKEIEIDIGEGIRVNGRIDLVKRKIIGGEDKVFIVDFKTRKDAELEEIMEEQLKIYALGYKALTGRDADYIELYNLHNNQMDRKKVADLDLTRTKELIQEATKAIRENTFQKHCNKEKCLDCDMSYLCLSRSKQKEYGI